MGSSAADFVILEFMTLSASKGWLGWLSLAGPAALGAVVGSTGTTGLIDVAAGLLIFVFRWTLPGGAGLVGAARGGKS